MTPADSTACGARTVERAGDRDADHVATATPGSTVAPRPPVVIDGQDVTDAVRAATADAPDLPDDAVALLRAIGFPSRRIPSTRNGPTAA